MSVRKRRLPSGQIRYEVRWRERGRHRSRLFDDDKIAEAFDRKLRHLRQAGELAAELERRRVTIEDLYLDWLDRAQPSLAVKTAENYAIQLDLRILPSLGSHRVAQLTVADVERWIAAMQKDGVGVPTILKSIAVLQALLSMAVRDGIVAVNVARQARKPKKIRTRVPVLIKPEEIEKIRLRWELASRERDVVLLDLLAYAGLRPESEAVTLRWAQVRDRSILVLDTKRRAERTIPMLDPLRKSLNAWRLRCGRPAGHRLVVPSGTGNPWTDYDWKNWQRRVFKPAATAVGLPADVRARDLRGSFVSLLVHEGRSIIEVAERLGHSPEVCLRDYAQIFDDRLDNRIPAASAIMAARRAARATNTTKRRSA